MRIRIETKVAPGVHFEAKRTLHMLWVEAFRSNNLEIPYPKAVGIEISAESLSASASQATSASA